MKSSPMCRRRVIKELSRGREFTNRLQQLLMNCQDNNEEVLAKDLIHEVLNSFVNTLSMFNRDQSDDELFHIQGCSRSSCGDGRLKYESLEETTNLLPLEDPGRCCKKRKVSHSWSVESPNWMMHDGHAWRKYGQKVIHKAKYPRNYYRCTHKTEQRCEATKQVQKIREHPALYRTTYFGHHTCKKFQQFPQLFFDDSMDEYDSAKLLRFGADNPSKQADDNRFLSSVSSLVIKQEYLEEAPCDQKQNQSSSSCADVVSGMNSSPSDAHSSSINIMKDSDESNFWDLVPLTPWLEELWQ